MTYTFMMLVEDTFKQVKIPMSAAEIWEKAKELGLTGKLAKYGKTPQETISARIYTEIKANSDKSRFIQVSKRPARFFLRELQQEKPAELNQNNQTEKEKPAQFSERELHPLLTKFVYSAPHFKCYTKTIYHEKSKNVKKGKNKWLHPDIVGVYYPFDDYAEKTISMLSALKENACKLFSFELKIEIDFANLRECYFQAVSNSSWANEGYLVALQYSEDPSLLDEMRRLNNSFGIGFIKLNAENIEQSEILFSSRFHQNIDWDTINRLVEENADFAVFVKSVEEDIAVSKVKSNYDRVLDDQEYIQHVTSKGIV